ncbi:MAG TPA: cobalamin B12-binding domain-containing protein [Mycobacteriales bacterium]|nr:cobalamin B12-binding domain-containing protein [Mycobacteriales bacterium]
MTADRARPLLRIGELSRRLGVSAHVLRAWERRYGLLQPQRSAGGYRLYSEADENRIRHMQAYLARGLSAAEAARAALDEDRAGHSDDPGRLPDHGVPDRGDEGPPPRPEGLAETAAALARALDGLDEPAAQAVLDRLFADFTVETVLRDVVIPYLHEIGERWQRGDASVAQEHFASNVLRGRLAGLARGWGHGHGPLAILACAPGDLHDLPLLAFGVVLNRHGWRIGYLGPDTPLEDLARVAVAVGPDLVVVTAAVPGRLDGLTEPLSRLARIAPLALAGAGMTEAAAEAIGARLLTDDPVTAAEHLPPPRAPGAQAGARARDGSQGR